MEEHEWVGIKLVQSREDSALGGLRKGELQPVEHAGHDGCLDVRDEGEWAVTEGSQHLLEHPGGGPGLVARG